MILVKSSDSGDMLTGRAGMPDLQSFSNLICRMGIHARSIYSIMLPVICKIAFHLLASNNIYGFNQKVRRSDIYVK